MATLMQWGNSEGVKGRCDAKCHNAKEPKCECMCGGRFHGKAREPGGLEKAVKEFWEEVVERAKERAEGEGIQLEVFGLQLSLFGDVTSRRCKDDGGIQGNLSAGGALGSAQALRP